MDRRNFLKVSAAVAAMLPLRAWSAAPAAVAEDGWRQFVITSRIEPVVVSGKTRVWVPLPSITDAQWIRPLGNSWQGNAAQMQVVSEAQYGASMLYVEWAGASEQTGAPWVEIVSRFATRDRATDFSRPAAPQPLAAAEHALYTRPTKLLPLDGVVRDTALQIVRGLNSDEEKARAIYDWVVDNTFREPKVKGCGIGDIRGMLETGNLSGKCADLNALYVGLARAAGLPARDVYGIRVADSRRGYQSLGKSGDVSKAQHCRAEVYLQHFGWVPVDPADVRKVVLEEPPGKLALDDARVLAARKQLFGAWEMNWLGYNFAHDVALPGSTGPLLPFLMYPQGEGADGRFDSLDPAAFRYRLSATEVTAD